MKQSEKHAWIGIAVASHVTMAIVLVIGLFYVHGSIRTECRVPAFQASQVETITTPHLR